MPPSFFGIAPQTELTEADTEYMRAARIGAVRWPLAWSSAQPEADGSYEWDALDPVVATAARQGLEVLPFVYSTPRWLARKPTVLPVANGRQRSAWSTFLTAAVERYGPDGEFWREHGPGTAEPLPTIPIVDWQIWNEANFFYFTTPASPSRYARLVKLSDQTMRRADPGASLILSGLFAEPSARPPRAMHAVDFLDRFYAVSGIKRSFEGVALHPYAEDAADLARMTEGLRDVIVDNRDPGARLYITEMGWGSQHNPNLVSFEQGVGFQLREMRLAYDYLIGNRGRLNLKGTYWFTWKDIPGSCNFCDSTGLFRRGDRLKPKPAWRTFVGITGGRARP
ncbi:MAG TPA: beta-galactosidase [Solirubrobacterales bacterium]|nr:beta-galactosidase [Solirubrobacterales bacterium]